MTPRTASLRVAHQANCPHANRTGLDSLRGCKCKPGPSYYVMWRDTSGATRKSARVRDRRTADRALRAKQVEIDRGRSGAVREKNIDFPAWVDEWEQILASRTGLKGETRRTYMDTARLAVDTIGHVRVRELGNPDLRKFHAVIAHLEPATQIKHLSHLSACLTAAVDDGYADRNPVGPFRKSLRLRAASGTPPYTDGELARLLVALRREDDVYLALVRVIAETGMRSGEAIALDWRNVSLTAGTLTIEHTYNQVDGLTSPKDGETRTVYLTPRAMRAFAWWTRRTGVKEEGLVFPAPRSGGYLNDDYLRKIVDAAMKIAGIPKVDPQSGRPRKPLHSLRATFSRRMLEQGRHPQWVEAQLGHSDLRLTMHTYGAWSEEAMRGEAAGDRLSRKRGRKLL